MTSLRNVEVEWLIYSDESAGSWQVDAVLQKSGEKPYAMERTQFTLDGAHMGLIMGHRSRGLHAKLAGFYQEHPDESSCKAERAENSGKPYTSEGGSSLQKGVNILKAMYILQQDGPGNSYALI